CGGRTGSGGRPPRPGPPAWARVLGRPGRGSRRWAAPPRRPPGPPPPTPAPAAPAPPPGDRSAARPLPSPVLARFGAPSFRPLPRRSVRRGAQQPDRVSVVARGLVWLLERLCQPLVPASGPILKNTGPRAGDTLYVKVCVQACTELLYTGWPSGRPFLPSSGGPDVDHPGTVPWKPTTSCIGCPSSSASARPSRSGSWPTPWGTVKSDPSTIG